MSKSVRFLYEHVTEMQKVLSTGKYAQATALVELSKYLNELEDENVLREKFGCHIENLI